MKKAFIAAMTVVALVAMGCASGSKTAQTPEEAEAAAAKAAEIQGLFELVDVEGGSYKMGDAMGEKDEFPVHTVEVGSFKMSTTEITQELYKKVMGTNPSYFKGEKLPVEKVSWLDAVKFCNKLSEIQGLDPCYTIGSSVSCDFNANGYRLPTEAEWEYAARGGIANEKFQYSGSDSIDEVAWYTGNSENQTHEVGTKAPNSLGIYDMSGNVWEWCWDNYSETYYTEGSQSNTKGPGSGDKKVLRGGSRSSIIGDGSSICRVSNRSSAKASESYYLNGFRFVSTSK